MEIPKAADLQVFAISGPEQFRSLALQVFRFQYHNNPVYRQYCNLLKTQPEAVSSVEQIPFLPIGCFKTHVVATTVYDPRIIFESSGTTGKASSRHFIRDEALYRKSFLQCFELFYGKPENYCILGLLPSYLERGNSSLVYMVQELVAGTGNPDSGFYLHDFERLSQTLQRLEQMRQKVLLIGVTYALLDFAERFPMALRHTIVMETGGMKGRRQELLREEVHHLLRNAFSIPAIHSEYGMTELLSQAYAKKDGKFQAPPWMRVLVREEDDPFIFLPIGKTGGLNIIDLANLYSCSFIATEDIGALHEDGTFSVAGRQDHAALRGCSLLYL